MDETHNQRLTVGIMATCLALAATSFALRIYARATTTAKLWYNDYWMAVVMLVSVAMSTSILLGLAYGSGTHQPCLAEETVQSFKKNLYLYMILWSFGVFAVKVGILLFYWRVFSTPRFRRSVLAVGGLWSTVEVEVGFICANLPSIRPLAFRCLGYRAGVTTGDHSDYSTPFGGRHYAKSGGESSAGLKTIGSKSVSIGGSSLSPYRDSDEEALTHSRDGSRGGSSRGTGEGAGQAIGRSDIMVKTHIGISVESQSPDPSPLQRSHIVQISSPKDSDRP